LRRPHASAVLASRRHGSFSTSSARRRELAGALFLDVLGYYHAAILAALDPVPDAGQGIDRLIRAHLDWVVISRREARYLFEISRSEWGGSVRDAQRAQNARLAEGIECWRAPLVTRGELLPMTPVMFVSQLIGPAQIFCRAFLSGRDRADPRAETDTLIACDGIEKHTATALASIAMLSEDVVAKTKNPAA
jgi:hypothetical protein